MINELKIPGKLMLAGEYAITLPDNPAIVFAINKFLGPDFTELEENEVKFGLGSSGAYSVLKTRQDYPELKDDDVFFKALEFSRNDLEQPNNSGADVAASVYGGMHFYYRDQLPTPLSFPKEWHLLVGWTQKPAITKDKVITNSFDDDFIKTSNILTLNLKEAIEDKDFTTFNQTIEQLENNLETISGVLTPELEKLISIAKKYGVNAKVSGAGGGDNGIAFTPDIEIAQQIKNEWSKNGIRPLELNIYYK